MTTGTHFSITTNGGQIIDLCSSPYSTAPGATIFGLPPVALTRSTRPGLAGDTVTARRWTAKDFGLPILISTESGSELRAALRYLVAALAATTDVVIRFDDGTVRREIVASLSSGAESIPVPDYSTKRLVVPFTFTAADPLWRAVEEDIRTLSVPLAQGGDSISYDDPVLSWDGSALFDGWSGTSGLVELPEILNNGDIEAWPRVEITGPATRVEIVNLSHPGPHVWAINTNLEYGETVIVDANPRHRQIRINNEITAGAFVGRFWPLTKGANRLVAVVEGMDPASSSRVSIQWRERWLSC